MMNEEIDMTMFEKEKFTWDGMYLMYKSDESDPWRNLDFIARFKYRKNYKSWINFLVKNKVSIETFFELRKTNAPLQVMWELGYEKGM
jgi:hypothetical protein